MAFTPIDASTYATDDTFAPIPVGEYLWLISGGKLDVSKNTGEEYLSFKLTILEGPKAKRVIFHNIWCYGENTETNEKRLNWFKTMVKAAGIVNLSDPAELNGKIVRASVSHYTAKDGTLKDSITPWSFKATDSAPLAPPTFQSAPTGSLPSSAPAPAWKPVAAVGTTSVPAVKPAGAEVGPDGIRAHEDDLPPF